MIDDGDGLAAVPAGELGGAQEGIILGIPLGIFFLFSDKEQDDIPLFLLLDVPLSSGGFWSGGILALPVEEPVIDRIIFIPGGFGKFLFRLVQSHQEYICVSVHQTAVSRMEVFHPFPYAVGFVQSQGRKNLIPGIVAIDFQGTGVGEAGLMRQDVEPFELEGQDRLDFLAEFWSSLPKAEWPPRDLLIRPPASLSPKG